MKAALVILHADPAKGGAETYTVDLAAALARANVQVTLLASSFSPAVDSQVEQVLLRHAGPTRLARYRSFLASLDTHLIDRTYDVVHAMLPVRQCDLYHPHAGIAAEALATGHQKQPTPLRQAAAKLANRLNRKRRAFADVERSLLMNGAAGLPGKQDSQRSTLSTDSTSGPKVLCLSEYVKSAVQRHYPLPDARLPTLINAVDLAKFDPSAGDHRESVRRRLGIESDCVVGLIVAQDFARKGLGEAVAAWRQIDDRRLVLLVVGKDDFTPYANQAEGTKHPKHLIYAGATRDVRPYYAAADFFVLPTRHDPCSLVVLEALAMGLPVISTRFNGACEVMTPGLHGQVLADPADVEALVVAMRQMLDDSTRTTMHDACLALRPRLSYDYHLERLLEIYAEIARSL